MHRFPSQVRARETIAAAGLVCVGVLAAASPSLAQEACFERLDNGVDLTGWQRSTTDHHGPGAGWTAEEGALVGRQTSGGQGGILMTDKAYRDVELVLEVKIDWGCDSGIFFRTTAGDRAYQVNIDHLMGGGIGSIYGEAFTNELVARDYTLTNGGNTAVAEACETPLFDLSTWSALWHPRDWNEIRVRMENNPPHIQVWISNTKVTDFTDSEVRAEIDDLGPLALQVHKGDRWVAGGAVRFRNIRVKDLTVPCGDARDAGAPPGGSADASPAAGLKRPPNACRSSGCSCTTARPSIDATAPLFLVGLCAARRRPRPSHAGRPTGRRG